MKAFPIKSSTFKNPNDCVDYHEYSDMGMDLRDYFAAKAMQAMITAFYQEEDFCGWEIDEISFESYRVADQMMEDRK